MIKAVTGTKDILPDEIPAWKLVEKTIERIFHNFNYKEIRTPVFEETSLFARGIGEETDIVGKEMYSFTDRSENNITLKPEMTASVVRAFIEHSLGKQQSLNKLYYISPMFRQERPQAGRLRQFHQFGAEALGSTSVYLDVEMMLVALAVYRDLGIEEFALNVNSVGCRKCRPPYKELLVNALNNVRVKLSPESQARIGQNPLRVLDSKDDHDRELTRNVPLMKDHLCPECADHFKEVQALLQSSGTPFHIDGRLVRGLDYYTKTAFEITSTALGSQDA